MMLRGKWSPIFASLGRLLGGAQSALDAREYLALIRMVALTTMTTPLGVGASFAARSSPSASKESP